jgi:hypothetical protein
MKTKLILLFSLSSLFMPSQAQSILSTPIEWSSEKYIDMSSNTEENDVFTIITNSSEVILSRNGRSRNFIVSSQQGTWSDLKIDGKLNLEVKYSEKDGLIIIERLGRQFYITIDFSRHPDGMKRKFIISNYQVK